MIAFADDSRNATVRRGLSLSAAERRELHAEDVEFISHALAIEVCSAIERGSPTVMIPVGTVADLALRLQRSATVLAEAEG